MDETYEQADAAADLIVDMRLDPMGVWSTSGGFVRIDGAGGSPAFRSCFSWSQHGGRRKWLVYEDENGSLYAWTGRGGAGSTLIQGNRSTVDGAGVQYATNGGWMYAIDGVNEPIRWDGAEVVRPGFKRSPAAPDTFWSRAVDHLNTLGQTSTSNDDNEPRQMGVGPRPSVEAATITPWRYAYVITEVNDLGNEGPPSGVAVVYGENTGFDVDQSPTVVRNYTAGKTYVALEWPEGAPHVRGWNLYRSENIYAIAPDLQRNVRLYQHSAHAYGGAMALMDGKSDADLGRELDRTRLGAWPEGVSRLAFFDGRLWLAGSSATPGRVYYSDAGLVEQFPGDNVRDLPGGQIHALVPYQDALVCMQRSQMHFIKRAWDGTYRSQATASGIGSVSPNAITLVPGVGLLFVAAEGVYILPRSLSEDTEPVPISQSIQRSWRRRVNTAALETACAVLYRPDREVWIAVPTGGSSVPNLVFVYHYDTGQWSTRTSMKPMRLVVLDDHRQYLVFASGDTTQPGLNLYGMGYATKAGSSFNSTYTSSWLAFGAPNVRTKVQRLTIRALANGRTGTVSYRLDRKEADVSLEVNGGGRTLLSTEQSYALWGTATWSTTDTWSDYQMTGIPVSTLANALEMRWSITGDRVCVAGVDVLVSPMDGEIQLVDASAAWSGI